ncbi:CgeB family protein [Lutibaculum baratangense]|uniref:Glycosyltransferase n=1 Tax=Lutibaculum baratangense AMV1 TaxID=631454 RepID=V4TGT9_9HYPH|nr:glycosyltransferase [Lutibaculum baratangense]ESR25303.1 Glycosyltransferase [Lutibaculum baratangense AMV1]
MRIVYFTHSLASCWNHGNAHFLRGILRDLRRRGHDAVAHEPETGWSRENLVGDHGAEPLRRFAETFPDLATQAYGPDFDPASALDGADLVIVHEWADPALVARIGRARRAGGRFVLLFHDTHHRAVSEPEAMKALDIADYDGVLAFGESLSEVYRGWGWGDRVFTWHEAADTSHFQPPREEGPRDGLVWIGNWGDGERTAELDEFLFAPAQAEGVSLTVHGVRYPDEALATLKARGADYRGWLPNAEAPRVFARHMATVHVPRRLYVDLLPGIPTIRVFEALACGIPLLSAPWQDAEGLFRPGRDYLVARTGEEMRRHIRAVVNDPGLRASLISSGLETIRARHSCAHRVDELLAIVDSIGGRNTASAQEVA